jgi:hypothetical protein
MAIIRFPSNKSLNQVVITNNVSYKWDGRKWRKLVIETIDVGAVSGIQPLIDSAISNVSVSDSTIRSAISASGSLSYNSSTGVISYTQRTDGQIRSLLSASGDLSYNSTTGAFSFTQADSASSWGGYNISVVASLPGSPDANTIYFVTG